VSGRLSTALLLVAAGALATAAAVDAVRSRGAGAAAPPSSQVAGPKRWHVELNGPAGFAAAGPGLRTRVDADGGEYLTAQTIRRAFPGPATGSLNIAKLAVADDRSVAIGLFRFPPRGKIRAAIEIWSGDRLVGAFSVPAGSFSSGLWFTDGGRALAAISWKGSAAVYDLQGRRLPGIPYVAYETK
jgi:hypothetical protein